MLKPVEAVRKSSLATNEKKRKTSFVSFKEEDTTIEFSEESGNEDIFLWNCMNDLFPPIVSDVNQSEVETKGNSILLVCRVLYILSDIVCYIIKLFWSRRGTETNKILQIQWQHEDQ